MLKKLINDPFEAVDEALEGFVAAHDDVVRLAAHRVVARRIARRAQGRRRHRRGFRPRAGVRWLRRASGWLTRRRSATSSHHPSPDICLAGIQAASTGSRRAPGLRQLRRRRPELRAGRGAGGGRGDRGCGVRVTDDVASAPAARPTDGAGSPATSSSSSASAPQPSAATTLTRSAPGDAGQPGLREHRRGAVPLRGAGVGRTDVRPRPDEIEIGMGVHGEPGIRRGPSSRPMPSRPDLVEAIVADWQAPAAPRRVALLVNGLGATATMEQYILYRAARRPLEATGCEVSRSYVGEFVTSLEMAGASISVTRPRRRAAGAPRCAGPNRGAQC